MANCGRYMVQCCTFEDDDRYPTCMMAAISVHVDVADEDVPEQVRQLMLQIANEMPMHLRSKTGRTPVKAELFWSVTPHPDCA